MSSRLGRSSRLLPLLTAALVVALASCSSGGDSDGDPTSTPTETTSSPTEPSTPPSPAPSTSSEPPPPAVPPAQDYPRLPKECASREEKIPQLPGACFLNEFVKSQPTVVLWGDSHAWQHIPVLRLAVGEEKVNLVGFVMGSCPPMDLDRAPGEGTKCEQNATEALDYIMSLDREGRPLKVVLGAYWRFYLDVLAAPGDYGDYDVQQAELFEEFTPKAFRALGRAGIDTDVIAQTVSVPEPAPCAAPYACKVPRADALREEAATDAWVRDAMRPLGDEARYLDPNAEICDDSWCFGRRDGIYTFFDQQHLTATRSRTLLPLFADVVADVLP
ncbi:MAG: SGNH hydrolase domain-containing protein [Nocardioides sp.]|nr:SGNH hydrolase domain-containing protein [Nocardioides sp.]